MKYEEFDQYLMLGENNELKNRYLLISAPEEFTQQAPDKLILDNIYICKVVKVIGCVTHAPRQ